MELEPAPRQTKIHGLIIGLMVVIILLSLVAVGAIMMTQTTSTSPEAVAKACQAEVQSAALDATREITRACQTDSNTSASATTTGHVPAVDSGLGFDYPLVGWSVRTERAEMYSGAENAPNYVLWNAALVPGYLAICHGCDGPLIDISMAVGSKSAPPVSTFPNFSDYLNSIYPANDIGYSNIKISASKDVGGERYTVTGHLDGLYTGDFEAIYFEGPTKWASITFLDTNNNKTDTNDAWTIVKDSLDFSGIQQ